MFIHIKDTSTTDYFNGRAGLKVSMDLDYPNNTSINNQQQTHRKPSLIKSDSIDVVDCKYTDTDLYRLIKN